MNNEEMNKKMEFIVEHQTKFAADIEMMRSPGSRCQAVERAGS
jgi:hypothetical protein